MYTAYFGLKLPPFRITPDTRRFFGGCDRAEILHALRYAIGAGEGMVKVTGEVGAGKTMLCQMLQETLSDSVVVVYLANPHLSPDEVTGALLMELGIAVDVDLGRLQQQRALQDYLIAQHRAGKRVVACVEEAQCMPEATLEALRLVSNLETVQDKLLQLVLFGQPELNQLLAKPELRQLRDRITHQFELRALDHSGVADYVRFRLYTAGYQGGELFSAAACRKLARASHGLIRKVHVLAEKALLAAYAEQSRRVERRHVEHAIRDGADHRAPPRARLRYAAALAAGFTVVTLAGIRLWNAPSDAGTTPDTKTIASASPEQISALTAIRPAAGGSYVTQRLSATAAWLAGDSDNRLTIQVLLTDDDDQSKLESLLRRDEIRPLLDDIYVRATHVSGRRRFSVLYGEFGDRAEAYQALAGLPDVLQVHKPYLRSLNAIRASFAAGRSQG